MIEFKRCADLATFQKNINSVSNEDFVFIEGEKLIWNNNTYYYCSDQVANQLSNGLMSKADKIKLDNIDLDSMVTVEMLNTRLGGYNIAVVTSLPESPSSNTIYIVK